MGKREISAITPKRSRANLSAGEADQVGHPAGIRRVADLIKEAEFGVVSRSDHYPWAENPDEFNH